VLSVNAKKNTVVVEHIAIIEAPQPVPTRAKHQGRHRRKGSGINVSNVMVVAPTAESTPASDTTFCRTEPRSGHASVATAH